MDTQIAIFIHNTIPNSPFLLGLFKAFTSLGNSWFLALTVFSLALYFVLKGKFHKANIVMLSGLLATILNSVVKIIVQRPRPYLWLYIDKLNSYSFPSGHAVLTTAIFGVMAYFLGEHFPKRRGLIYTLGGLLLFMIGLSRVYLGVHWPSDVLAGWLLGGLLLAALIWWYHKGGIVRALRIALGCVFIIVGIFGLVIPIIPGILLIIGGGFLVFSDKSISDIFKKKPAGN